MKTPNLVGAPSLLLPLVAFASFAFGQDAQILEIENIVQVAKSGMAAWAAATDAQSLAVSDRIRTRQKSRATVKLTDLYTMRMEQFTTIEISPKLVSGGKPELNLSGGAAFIFSREEGGEIGIKTPAANGALKGTQLFVQVSGGRSFFHVIEGSVEMGNSHGRVLLNAGEAGEAAPGSAPRKTASISAKNILQWALYYPGVLDPSELGMSAAEQRAVAASLAAYREGDLLGALEKYPNRAPGNTGGRLYKAGVLVAVGRVDEARVALRSVDVSNPGRRALERMIAAVNYSPSMDRNANEPNPDPSGVSVSEEMAESYFLQSRGNLEGALAAARRAAAGAPQNGYAWTRVAELEFSFGRTAAARRALEKGLSLTPKNAQAHALHGFILSAENRIRAAQDAFEQAIRLDGALGNAWLGRGLVRIKSGRQEEGRADLQTAATVEPASAIFHSYLGKAFSAEGRKSDARKDLDLAKQIDPNDPTPWLYSAVQHQQENRYNAAIGDIEESLRLNDNRRIYRSQFLLDQDRAIRSSNLAKVYQNAGMTDLAVREATRAVESDYTNASAHLFLSNSFDALRDPNRISLRYETVWFNELLLAYLLAPVGGGPLSQFVSQQEYSKLLEAEGVGGSYSGEWRDNGRLDQRASVFATYGRLSLGFDFSYLYDNGDRPNSETSREEVYWQAKYQASPDDVFYTLGKWQDQESGDLFQNYGNLPGSLGLDFEEKQEPGLLLGGWNHRWAPGVHTLFLGGRLAAEQVLTDPATRQLLLTRVPNPKLGAFLNQSAVSGQIPAVVQNPDQSLTYSREFLRGLAPFLGRGAVASANSEQFSFATLRQFEIYTGEVQHIWDTKHNTLILGGRWQGGEFETDTRLGLLNPVNQGLYPLPAVSQHVSLDFERHSLYAYDFMKPAPWITLIAGASWDHIERPENFRNPPVSERQTEVERLNGKFGFTLSPSRWFTVRGVYTEGLGGVTFDESVRLEPSQLAGFNQAFRTLISEDIAGSVETPLYKNWGLSIEGALPTRSWWGASFNILEQDVERTLGAFDLINHPIFPAGAASLPGGTTQTLAYREEVLSAGLNQLIGSEWAVGLGYRHTYAELRTIFQEVPVSIERGADQFDQAVLHEGTVYANWNSPSGLFARAELNWYSQELDGAVAGARTNGQPGDDFWQVNAQLGYRFRNNLCEVSAGVLNLNDTDYQLSPLTYLRELPHERTFFVRCRFSF
ncbi:MAG: hypothetical protein RL088_1570 [Verrucomicrobiota bacterium]